MQLQLKHIKKHNPIHTNVCALVWLAKQKGNITLSPKADGVYSELTYKNYIFQGEYIKELDIYLIFDTLTYPIKHSNTLMNRYKFIQNLHVMKKDFKNEIIMTQKQMINKIINDTTLLEKYIGNTIDKIKWFPKITFQLNMEGNIFLSLLDVNIETYLLYKTDGYIITSLKNIGKLSSCIYKYKPKNELTIDILYNGNVWYMSDFKQQLCLMTNVDDTQLLNFDNKPHIFRCYWNDNAQMWIPKEIRFDKVKPNNINIINELESLHKNYWTASQLSNSSQYYYDDTVNKLDINYIHYLQTQRAIYKNVLLNVILKFNTILDIGCGKGYLLKVLGHSNPNKNITLVDINPANIFVLQNKYDKKYKFICSDMNLHSTFLNMESYEMIIFNNSLHYMNDVDDFLDNINQSLCIYIHFIDADLINDNFEYNNIKITKLKQKSLFEFSYPWKKNKFCENLLSFTELHNKMEKHNWILKNMHNYDDNDEFIKIHKYVIYVHN